MSETQGKRQADEYTQFFHDGNIHQENFAWSFLPGLTAFSTRSVVSPEVFAWTNHVFAL